MLKIDNLKEISKMKKSKYYSSIILIMPNEDKNIIISDSKGLLHIYESTNNFKEILTIEFKKENFKSKNNEINFISIKGINEILITFSELIKCISINKELSYNKIIYNYKEIFSLSLNLRDFNFYQCISLTSIENQLVSSCLKEIIHSWIINNNNNNNNSSYRVKKVISVCNKDTSSYLLEIPILKLLVTCSFKDCVLKFFDLNNNYKLIKRINKIGQGYYEGCLSLINSYLFIISGEGIKGMYLIDGRYKEIVEYIQINGYNGWINCIYANINYNEINKDKIIFYVGGEFEDNKKNFSCNFQEYGIVNGEIKLLNNKSDVHDEKMCSIVYYLNSSYKENKNISEKYIFWSVSKVDIKIWSN